MSDTFDHEEQALDDYSEALANGEIPSDDYVDTRLRGADAYESGVVAKGKPYVPPAPQTPRENPAIKSKKGKAADGVPDTHVKITHMGVVRQTEKAILLQISEELGMWVPKSTCIDMKKHSVCVQKTLITGGRCTVTLITHRS